MADIEIRDNPGENRWELSVDGVLAVFSAYHDHGSRRTFTHTETQDGFEGQGLASQLVRAALDDAKARALEINPLCPFVRAYLERHPEYGVGSGSESPPGGVDAGDQG
jgi:predicted GNAT family acetyltransferase